MLKEELEDARGDLQLTISDLRVILEATPAFVCALDPHGHVSGWNTAAIAEWTTPGCLPGGEKDDGTWRHQWHMRGAEEMVRCCTQGFPLRYEGDRERDVEQRNGSACQEQPETTANELKKEVAAGRILGPYKSPPLPGFKCVPRGLKIEPTKARPISMANLPFGDSVNNGIPRAEHIHLTRSRDIDRRIAAQRRQRRGNSLGLQADTVEQVR